MQNQAVISDPIHPDRLVIREVPFPEANAGDAVIAVTAFSLNAGEVRDAFSSDVETRPGWDIAGTIVRAASDGTGPAIGTRVCAFAGIGGGGWARFVAVPTTSIGVVPQGVPDETASCIPVAGLTALYAIEQRGSILGRSVLVTGGTGGVGLIAAQLGIASGAAVHVGSRRSSPELSWLMEHGATSLVSENDPLEGVRFDLILESVGGASLARSLSHLEEDGVCVLFGNSSSQETTLAPSSFYHPGRSTLRGLFLGTEIRGREVGADLTRLLQLVALDRLHVVVGRSAVWTEIGDIARRFREREFPGKVVLTIPE